MSASTLVVEPSLKDLLMLVPLLHSLGLQITVAESFQEAKHAMRVPPLLLIAEVRLGEFNGLHLVLRGRASRPAMAAIVTSETDDPVIRTEAEAMTATFVPKPTTPEEWRAAIARTLLRDQNRPFEPIRPPFERRVGQRRVQSATDIATERRQSSRRVELGSRLQSLVVN
jgi:DNA-binding response OmpR family regulator